MKAEKNGWQRLGFPNKHVAEAMQLIYDGLQNDSMTLLVGQGSNTRNENNMLARMHRRGRKNQKRYGELWDQVWNLPDSPKKAAKIMRLLYRGLRDEWYHLFLEDGMNEFSRENFKLYKHTEKLLDHMPDPKRLGRGGGSFMCRHED